jgi:Sec-independent protein secretion pathway component TatC
MPQGITIESLSQLSPVLLYLTFGIIMIATASGLFVASPIVFLPSVGQVEDDLVAREKRKTSFMLMLIIGVALAAAGWWSFSEATGVLDAFQIPQS